MHFRPNIILGRKYNGTGWTVVYISKVQNITCKFRAKSATKIASFGSIDLGNIGLFSWVLFSSMVKNHQETNINKETNLHGNVGNYMKNKKRNLQKRLNNLTNIKEKQIPLLICFYDFPKSSNWSQQNSRMTRIDPLCMDIPPVVS